MALELCGYTEEEVIGKHYLDVINFETEKIIDEKRESVTEKLFKNKIPPLSKLLLRKKNGDTIPISTVVSPLIGVNDEKIGNVVIFRDSTHERQVDFAKTEFISLASHEMRTPLSTINWHSEMLLDEDFGKLGPKQKEYLYIIYDASKRMSDLVNSLLNVSRLELGTFAIEPESVKIIEIAQTCVKDLKTKIQEKGLFVREMKPPRVKTLGFLDNNLFPLCFHILRYHFVCHLSYTLYHISIRPKSRPPVYLI